MKFARPIYHRIIWILTLAAIVFGLARAYYNLTDDFRLANITNDIPNRPEWNTHPLNEMEQNQILSILDQKFHYIGKGAQSYAFSSEDGKYVLKFMKSKHLKPSRLLELLSSVPVFTKYRQKDLVRKEGKLTGVYNGYLTAYEIHKNQTGLIFIHFNRTNNFKKNVILYDKLGFEHSIDPNSVVFVLQKKGKTLRAVLGELLDRGDTNLVKLKIRQIFDLYLSEYQKGIYDHDHGVMRNTGFVGDVPIHLDLGKLYRAEEMKNKVIHRKDFDKVVDKIELWMSECYPQYYSEIKEDMKQKYIEFFGESRENNSPVAA